MMHRYFLIEPLYADPDSFCEFRMGSGRIHASIQIYADIPMLLAVARDLARPAESAYPFYEAGLRDGGDGDVFTLNLTVSAGYGDKKILRCQVLQDYLDDGAPFRADIKFQLSAKEAHEFASDLCAWCERPNFPFVWKGD